jgi:hypothetical protein
MKKIPAVEQARHIMTEGIEWGVWKWLMEKKRVREVADQARAALDECEMKVKLSWGDEYKIAYNQLVTENSEGKRPRKHAKGNGQVVKISDPKILATVKRIAEADDEAYTAHENAEDVFAEAERKMSTSLAREGARKALEAYDLHEAAIRKSELLAREKA